MFSADPLKLLASRFLDATVAKWGTEEAVVADVLKSASENRPAFERAVANQLGQTKTDQYITEEGGDIVSAILKSELSSAELATAQTIWKQDWVSASRWDYLWTGLASTFDWSSDEAKAMVVGGFALCGILGLVSAPLTVGVTSLLGFGTVVYGVGRIGQEGAQALMAKKELDVRSHIQNLGAAFGTTLISLPLAPKGFELVQKFLGAAKDFMFPPSAGMTTGGLLVAIPVVAEGAAQIVTVGFPTILMIAGRPPFGGGSSSNILTMSEKTPPATPKLPKVALSHNDINPKKASLLDIATIQWDINEASRHHDDALYAELVSLLDLIIAENEDSTVVAAATTLLRSLMPKPAKL